jgi:hypothetical protein
MLRQVGASGRSLGVVQSNDGANPPPTWVWNASMSAVQYNDSSDPSSSYSASLSPSSLASRGLLRCLTSNTNGVFSNVAVGGCPVSNWQAQGNVNDFDAAASALLNTSDRTVRFVFRCCHPADDPLHRFPRAAMGQCTVYCIAHHILPLLPLARLTAAQSPHCTSLLCTALRSLNPHCTFSPHCIPLLHHTCFY